MLIYVSEKPLTELDIQRPFKQFSIEVDCTDFEFFIISSLSLFWDSF